jgi:hypothetical protein
MDDTLCQLFFEHPACPAQRQYEALRAVFIDGLSQKDAAERFGYAPDAFRHLVHRFRQDIAAGTRPPFSPLMAADDPRGRPSSHPHGPTRPIAPTCAS